MFEAIVSLLSFIVATVLIVLLLRLEYKKVRKPLMEVYREHKVSFVVYIVLRSLIVFTAVRMVYNGEYYNAFLCVLSLVLMLLPALIQKSANIVIPSALEIIIFAFIFAAEILGEINSYYTVHYGWDTILHTLSGFLCAAVGFSLFNLLNSYDPKKFKISALYMAVMAFCFANTVGVFWEFGEFAFDRVLLNDAQKDFVVQDFGTIYFDETNMNNVIRINDIVQTDIITADGTIYTIEGGYLDIGIVDTMKDLFVNCVGALIFCVIGYISIKTGKENFLFTSLVPYKEKKETEALEEIEKSA